MIEIKKHSKRYSKRYNLKNFLLAAFFAMLTAVGGMLTIPVPPVPFTLQTFFVQMSGLFLGPKYGPMSQIIYIALGLTGLPIFAGGVGGLQHIFSPSFSFLIGFIAESWVAGLLISYFKIDANLKINTKININQVRKQTRKACVKYILICLAATVALYAVALPGFYLNMRYIVGTPVTISKMFELAMLPFVIPDFIKAVVAGILAYKIMPMLINAGLIYKL